MTLYEHLMKQVREGEMMANFFWDHEPPNPPLALWHWIEADCIKTVAKELTPEQAASEV